MFNRPIREIEISALGDCEKKRREDKVDCKCQIVDKNGENAILAP